MCRRLSSSRIKLSSLWGQWQGKEKAMQTHTWTQAAGGDGIWGHFQGWQISADELKVQNRLEEWIECWYLELLLVFYRQGCGQRNAGISPLQSFANALGHLTMLITMVFVFVYFLFLLTCRLFLWLLFTHNFLTGPSFLPHVAHPCCLVSWAFLFIFRYLVEPRSVLHCTALLVHSIHRRFCFVSLCWFSQCVWFPSCWCLGHICSQIHM